jgi:hypothetical protein
VITRGTRGYVHHILGARRAGAGFTLIAALVALAALPLATTSAQEDPCRNPPEDPPGETTETAPEECPPPAGPPPAETTPAPAPPPPASAPAPARPPVSAPPAPPGSTEPQTEPRAPRARRPRCRSRRRPARERYPRSRKRLRRCRERRARRPARGRSRRRETSPGLDRTKPPRPDGSAPRLLSIARLARRPLPDPLPAGRRLAPGFASELRRVSAEEDADWALVLATLRARGGTGATPAGAAELRRVASGLPRRGGGERVRALARYHRAVGLRGLVRGMHAVKRELARRVLGDGSISIYAGGRGDLQAGRIDVRVLVLMLYLADAHDGIGVTSLIAGHSIYTRSGSLSLHPFGQAVDISTLGGVPVLGHQQPGGVVERALRDVMLLPEEMRPSELISLFDMGGPSLAMADHADHVHVGF